jgi:hypothetical protein
VIYVSSYPLGTGETPPGADTGEQPPCFRPHRKISIVTVPFTAPDQAQVKEQPLSTHTRFSKLGAFQACHDIQAFLPLKVAVGACGGEAQIWDLSDPLNPTTTDQPGRRCSRRLVQCPACGVCQARRLRTSW